MGNDDRSGSDGLTDLRKAAIRRLARARKRPTPTPIHTTRVALRILRSALMGDDRKVVGTLRKEFKSAFKSLSPVRDADVLLELLEGHGIVGDDPIRARILKSRARDWKAARPSLNRVESHLHRKASTRLLGSSSEGEDTEPALKLPDLLEAVLAFDPDLRTETDGEVFHDARIAVKHLRYAVEQVSGIGTTWAEVVATLKGLQGALGELHDEDVLIATLVDEIARETKESTPEQEAALRQVLTKARRRRAALRKRAVTDWTAAMDGGLGDAVLVLAQAASVLSGREQEVLDRLVR